MRRRFDIINSQDNLDDFGLSDERSRKSIYSMHLLYGVAFVLLFGGLLWTVHLVENILPTPLKIADEETNPDAFIAERAHNDLKLMNDFGPRIVGSHENEVLTVDFLIREIGFIIQQANKNQKIEQDLQIVSGAYNISVISVTLINTYANIQNVVVKVHGKGTSQSNILINSHFDSVPTSPGSSDDGIMVVTMLEVLRKISRRKERPTHNLIFLFNGAEETPLQAAHGFITQHKWAKDCKLVINLDSAGHGGKAVLFQTGPKRAWIMKYYNKVPHPHGQVAGEEMFQSGLIPSDTDFRIFRDFGGLIGLDFAFYKNGYVYHTKYDRFSHLPKNSIQFIGDNVLTLVTELSDAQELFEGVEVEEANVIYFDYLGLFNVSYTHFIGTILNSVTVIFSFIIFLVAMKDFGFGFTRDTMKHIFITMAAVVTGWITSLLFTFIVAKILDLTNYTMSWYTSTWMILFLYVAPTVAFSSLYFLFIKHKIWSINVQTQIQAHCVRLIWTMLLLLGVIFNVRSAYAICLPVLFNAAAFGIIHLLKWHHSVRKWQILYVLTLIIPTLLSIKQALVTSSLFVPITGRFGPDKNPDMIIGMMSTVFTILITSSFVVLISLVRNSKYLLAIFGMIFITGFIIVFTPLGVPYTADVDNPTPQRYWILHTSRKINSELGESTTESGYFLLNMDRNSPRYISKYVPDMKRARTLHEDCEKYFMCGLPLAHSKMMTVMQFSTWIPAGQPVINQPAVLRLNSKEHVSPNVIRYNFTASGPDRTVIYLSPKNNRKLVSISLLPSKPKAMEHKNREMYYILHTYGIEGSPRTFTFDVEVPDTKENTHIEIAMNGIYVHYNKFAKTPHYKKFLDSFPEWADLTAWLGTYESWIL